MFHRWTSPVVYIKKKTKTPLKEYWLTKDLIKKKQPEQKNEKVFALLHIYVGLALKVLYH